jgi:hypothetical protein
MNLPPVLCVLYTPPLTLTGESTTEVEVEVEIE